MIGCRTVAFGALAAMVLTGCGWGSAEPCSAPGASRCRGGAREVCRAVGFGKSPSWFADPACHARNTCALDAQGQARCVAEPVTPCDASTPSRCEGNRLLSCDGVAQGEGYLRGEDCAARGRVCASTERVPRPSCVDPRAP